MHLEGDLTAANEPRGNHFSKERKFNIDGSISWTSHVIPDNRNLAEIWQGLEVATIAIFPSLEDPKEPTGY